MTQVTHMCLCVFLVLTICISMCFRKNKYEAYPSGFELCRNPNHKSITDCQHALKNRQWGEFKCEIANIMFYTVQIRRNIERQKNYTKVIRVFEHIMKTNMEFPLECRIIGSMCTNILQCSSDPTEAAWAQAVNMFIQFEKLHIFLDWEKKSDSSCEYNRELLKTRNNPIFEIVHCDGDIFRNVYIRDVEKMKAFPLVLFLYKRALKLLITEPRSVTYSVYFNEENVDHQVLNTFLDIN